MIPDINKDVSQVTKTGRISHVLFSEPLKLCFSIEIALYSPDGEPCSVTARSATADPSQGQQTL